MAAPKTETTGGVSSPHPSDGPLPLYLATTTRNERNVIREELQTVACWRLNDLRFDFGSSFVLPAAQVEFIALRLVCDAHPHAPLSIFGHADPIGDDDYNKILSGRRAEAIYAIVTHDALRWERLYSTPEGDDTWNQRHLNAILDALGFSTVSSFQRERDLVDDGVAGPLTRAVLFAEYLPFLFSNKLAPSAFIGGGLDPGGKAAVQGCSEFNPALVFSTAEQAAFEKSGDLTARNLANSNNRRVMILFFRPGTQIAAERWPCPRISEGVAGCRKRLWSDGDYRRAPRELHREFADNPDTFACRFYHRLTHRSPCESATEDLLFVEIFIDVGKDEDGFEDQFQLVSENGEYDSTLGRSAALENGEKQVKLLFTNVIAGQRYTLLHFPTPGAGFIIFSQVPFDQLDSGDGVPQLQVLQLHAREFEPRPQVTSDDPLLLSALEEIPLSDAAYWDAVDARKDLFGDRIP